MKYIRGVRVEKASHIWLITLGLLAVGAIVYVDYLELLIGGIK